jgi:hypothetical protein
MLLTFSVCNFDIFYSPKEGTMTVINSYVESFYLPLLTLILKRAGNMMTTISSDDISVCPC